MTDDNDALRNKAIETGGGGLFTKLEKGKPIKIRVLTVDPVINKDIYGNTRYAFVIWNFTDDMPQIMNKGGSIARQFQTLHLDEDYGADIRKIDLKITGVSTGPESKDVEYTVTPLPNAKELTKEQLKKASEIKLDEKVTGARLSTWNRDTELPTPTISGDTSKKDDSVEDDDEPISLDDIPF